MMALLWIGMVGGCANSTAVSSGQNTALDGGNLVEITDDMAMKLAGSQAVRDAIAREGPLKIVVEPVENALRAEVLPTGPAEAFTARLRTLLSHHDPKSFTWIMNRQAFYDLRHRELEMDLGPSPDAIQPQYALTAKFSSLTNEDSNRRSAYYLCVYSLTDLEHRTVLWTDKYEVKKTVVKGFLD
jgi:hypothetical protein